MRMNLVPTLVFATFSLVGACASEPKPRPTRIDPANPTAAESPSLTVSSFGGAPARAEVPPSPAARAEGEERPAPDATHGEHQHGAGATPSETGAKDQPAGGDKKATIYTCPMHPEVVSDKPGRCPKCGMNLVPKAEAPPPKDKK